MDEEPWNNKYSSYDKLTLLLLLPFFNVKDVYHFQSSKLHGMFSWGLLTTDLNISFEKACKTYSTRWSIAALVNVSYRILMLRYHIPLYAWLSILYLVKRFAKYEILGEMFRQTNADSLELTISERVWRMILSMVARTGRNI